MKITAILLMSGEGSRFGSEMPKQFYSLLGQKIYTYSLETLHSSDFFQEVVLVCPFLWVKKIQEETQTFSNTKVIPGGKTRQESSYLGLLACSADTDYVLMHDAARPFITKQIIAKNIEAVQKYKAVNTCIKTTDTLVYSSDQKWIETIPDRSKYFRGQTPQTFEYQLIKKAHENALMHNLHNISDDCRLIREIEHPLFIVEGDETNIKITSPHDIHFAEKIIQKADNLAKL